jgi:hypothetical protein
VTPLGEAILIAQVQDAVAEKVAANEVLYRDVDADGSSAAESHGTPTIVLAWVALRRVAMHA